MGQYLFLECSEGGVGEQVRGKHIGNKIYRINMLLIIIISNYNYIIIIIN